MLPLFYIQSVVIIVNPPSIKPIHGFQVGILSGIADADDGIGLHIFGFYLLSLKLRMDFLFAIASIIAFPAIPSSGWHTDRYSHRWGFRRHH